jgi:hypothetical protein
MNYFVKRGEQEYGPYTLAALQQYVQQGNISRDDLARSEAMTDWVFVSQIVGNVSVAAAPGAFGSVVQGAMVRPGTTAPLHPAPSLHWGIVLLLSVFTLGIFYIIWFFVEAVWVRKVRPDSKAIFLLVAYVAAAIVEVYLGEQGSEGGELLFRLIGAVFAISAAFSMRSDIEDYYNTEEPVGLKLSGVMTFFFSVLYFQYHFNDIKKDREQAMRAAAAGGAR